MMLFTNDHALHVLKQHVCWPTEKIFSKIKNTKNYALDQGCQSYWPTKDTNMGPWAALEYVKENIHFGHTPTAPQPFILHQIK